MNILIEINNLINEIKLGPKSLITGGLLAAGTIGGVGGIPGLPSKSQVTRAANMAKTAYNAYIFGRPLGKVVGTMITKPPQPNI